MIRKILNMLAIVALVTSPVLAEGSLQREYKEYGINRRVNTDVKAPGKTTGYIGVKGIFNASVAETPPLVYLSKEEQEKHPERNPNQYKSTPTCYLGSHLSHSDKQVDAGIQYYNNEIEYASGNKLYPGWGAFINYDNNTITPKTAVKGDDNQIRWEGYRDTYNFSSTIDYSMQYKVITTGKYKGYISLTVHGGGLSALPELTWSKKDIEEHQPTEEDQFFPDFDNDGKQAYTGSESKSLAVKRVLGMTQDSVTTYALDGSKMVGTFSKGKVAEYGAGWHDWEEGDVYQGETGYDVGESTKDAQWNNNDTVKSEYIVTFPNIDKTDTLSASDARLEARRNTTESYALEEEGNSRYMHETIKISLRSATKMTGGKSEPRQVSSK